MSVFLKHLPETTPSHSLIGHQPARIVLLDTSSPNMTLQALSSVCDALENVLCVGANMSGPSRIPLLGMYLLSSYPEIVLPLSCTKGNFARLHTAVEDIRTFVVDTLPKHQHADIKPCITEAVLEACGQFRRFTKTPAQASTSCSRLELIILTGHHGNFIQKQFSHLSDQVDLSTLKRILSATVTDTASGTSGLNADEEMDAFGMEDDVFGGMVDMVTVDCDSVSLQKFFYSWLNTSSSESEHLHLLLPPSCPGDQDLTIKCDFAEKMISPLQLPFHDAYSVHSDSNICKHVFPPPSKAIGMSVPLQQLKVVAVVGRDQVCESVVFGTPLLVVPTTCWKMDWDVLERNQELFVSLSGQLQDKDQVLLVQAIPPPVEPPQQRRGKAPPNPKPLGYFLLMPSENRSMLIKSIVPQELLLPSNHVISPGITDPATAAQVQASLSQVRKLPDLNPLSLSCGLFSSLRHASLPRQAVDRARPVKRKADSSVMAKAGPGQLTISDIFQPRRPEPSQAVVPGGRLMAKYGPSSLTR